MRADADHKRPPSPRLDSAPMRPATRSVLCCAAIAVGASLLVAGCGGGEETITAEQAEEIKSLVENAQENAENDDCDDSERLLADAEEEIAALDLGGDVGATADELLTLTEEELQQKCTETGPTSVDEPVPTETIEDPVTETEPIETTDTSTDETDTDTDTTDDEGVTIPPGQDEVPPPGQDEVPPPGQDGIPPGQDDDGVDDGTGGAVPPGQSGKRSKPKKAKPGKEAKKPKSKEKK
jgi:hypothetical protein